MPRCEDHLDLPTTQVDRLAITQVFDRAFVVGHHLRHVHHVCRIDINLREAVDGLARMVGMHMGSDKRNRLGGDPRHDLIQLFDVGASIEQDRPLLTLDQVERLVRHQVAIALPGMCVDLTENHVGALIDHLFLIRRFKTLCEHGQRNYGQQHE